LHIAFDLDVIKERPVNEAISQLKLTKIMVAHRLETIHSAGRVLVMDGGRLCRN